MIKENLLKRHECYLVQSGVFNYKSNDEIQGRHSIIKLNYMGYSEFEWNALPKSTNRMLFNIEFYDVFTLPQYVNKNGEELKIYAPRMFINHIENIVTKLANGNLNSYLKVPCTLSQYLKGEDIKDDFWWDIENDFYIFFGEKNEKLILHAQNAMIQRGINNIEIGNWNTLSKYYLLYNQDLDDNAKEFLNQKKSFVKKIVKSFNHKTK